MAILLLLSLALSLSFYLFLSFSHTHSLKAPDRFNGTVPVRLSLNDDAWRAVDALQSKIDRLRAQVHSLPLYSSLFLCLLPLPPPDLTQGPRSQEPA